MGEATWNLYQHMAAVTALPHAPADLPEDCTRVEPHIPCVDVWPPGTLTPACRAAYDQLAANGEIRRQSLTEHRITGVVTARYLSDCPHEWILDRLRRYKVWLMDEQARQTRL